MDWPSRLPGFDPLSELDASATIPDSGGETIYALSSGAPPAGVAIIRISGPATRAALVALSGKVPSPRTAVLRELRDPDTGEVIDRGLVLFFPSPASFTGEDVGELQVHGGRAVVTAFMRVLDGLGLRLAEAGEFTKRAFLAGRMDLTEAEGLADLVAAETEAQRRLALGTMEGSIRSQYESWRERIIRARGLIEAELDFSDEEGVAGAWSARGKGEARAIAAELRAALSDLKRGQRIREGASVVIAGAVNAGKSSLINAIARREVAIVSPEPGTTRDVIEIAADLAGFRVKLVDTAGFREAEGAIEREGMRRARNRAEEADLVLWLWADESELTPPPGITGPIWFVGTKSDLMDRVSLARAKSLSRHVISTVSGYGVEALLNDIGAFLSENLRPSEPAIVTRSRHAKSLTEAAFSLEKAIGCADAVIAAEHLRRASHAIGRVTGRVDVEDVLDVVFREFCIGK